MTSECAKYGATSTLPQSCEKYSSMVTKIPCDANSCHRVGALRCFGAVASSLDASLFQLPLLPELARKWRCCNNCRLVLVKVVALIPSEVPLLSEVLLLLVGSISCFRIARPPQSRKVAQ